VASLEEEKVNATVAKPAAPTKGVMGKVVQVTGPVVDIRFLINICLKFIMLLKFRAPQERILKLI